MNGSQAAAQSEGASRRSVVLVTGMSGSGKSTVLTELKRHGHRVIDTDDPGWIVETLIPGGPEPVWDLDQMKAVIDGHLAGWLFIAGCGANQGAVYDCFDAVVLLSAPVDVILDRVVDRANPFGSTAEDRMKITNDLAAFEPLLRAGADAEIVTTAPVPEVVAALEQIASGAALPGRSFAGDGVPAEGAATCKVVEIAYPPRTIRDCDVRRELAAEVGPRDLPCVCIAIGAKRSRPVSLGHDESVAPSDGRVGGYSAAEKPARRPSARWRLARYGSGRARHACLR